MIIELPILPSDRAARRFRMAFFHFSNNNLSIRRECALSVGGYDPEMLTSEDVEICFRVALSDRWVACREPGVVVRHKARRTLRGMVKQLWGWGINLGKAYRKTGIRGAYLYWVSSSEYTISRDFEWPGFPILFTGFITVFHVAHLLLLGGLLAGLLISGWTGAALIVAGAALVVFAMRNVGGRGLGAWRTLQLGAVAYVANLTFMTAAFVGALRAGIVYIPAAMFPPGGESERLFYDEDESPAPAAQSGA